MKASLALFLGALAVAALGAASLAWGRLDRELANAEQEIATLAAAGVDPVLARAEHFYTIARRLPFVGNAPLNDVQAERAALRYWQHEYTAIIPAQADPIGALPLDNVELQFIVANAVFRQGQFQPGNPEALARALDAGIAAQLTVLKNSVRNEDAAFNYEYLLRLRAALLSKRSKVGRAMQEADAEKTPHGKPGGPPRESDQTDFKIHVPMESKELRHEEQEDQEAGKGGPPPRRG